MGWLKSAADGFESLGNHEDALKAKGSMAIVMKQQGDIVGARKLTESVLNQKQKWLGKSNPSTVG